MALVLAGTLGLDKKKKRPFNPLPARAFSRWGPIPKRKRWSTTKMQLSDDVKHIADVVAHKSPKEAKLYFLKLQLGQVAQKLYNPLAALLQNPGELSPSPEPIYDSKGKRLNTREFRYREKLEEERNTLLTQILNVDPTFKIPSNWKKPMYKKKIPVPVHQFPEVNFFGLIVGPRGMTQKRISKETGCSILVRGKGSFVPGKPGRTPQPDDDEPMYVSITGNTQAAVDKAEKMIKTLLDQSQFGKAQRQLVELKQMLGWGGNPTKRCRICGGVGHPIWKCPDRPGADWDPAQVQCEICGEVTHITKDCKLFKKGQGLPAEGKAMSLDDEYKSFLKDLAGDGPMSGNSNKAITGSVSKKGNSKFPVQTKHNSPKKTLTNTLRHRTGSLSANAFARNNNRGGYRGRGGGYRGNRGGYRGGFQGNRGRGGFQHNRGGYHHQMQPMPAQPWAMGPPVQQWGGQPNWLQPVHGQPPPMQPYGQPVMVQAAQPGMVMMQPYGQPMQPYGQPY